MPTFLVIISVFLKGVVKTMYLLFFVIITLSKKKNQFPVRSQKELEKLVWRIWESWRKLFLKKDDNHILSLRSAAHFVDKELGNFTQWISLAVWYKGRPIQTDISCCPKAATLIRCENCMNRKINVLLIFYPKTWFIAKIWSMVEYRLLKPALFIGLLEV